MEDDGEDLPNKDKDMSKSLRVKVGIIISYLLYRILCDAYDHTSKGCGLLMY